MKVVVFLTLLLCKPGLGEIGVNFQSNFGNFGNFGNSIPGFQGSNFFNLFRRCPSGFEVSSANSCDPPDSSPCPNPTDRCFPSSFGLGVCCSNTLCPEGYALSQGHDDYPVSCEDESWCPSPLSDKCVSTSVGDVCCRSLTCPTGFLPSLNDQQNTVSCNADASGCPDPESNQCIAGTCCAAVACPLTTLSATALSIAFCGGIVGAVCPRETDTCVFFPNADFGPCCKGKPGRCPAGTEVGICQHECDTDFECRGDRKCCNNGCGRVCSKPEPLIRNSCPEDYTLSLDEEASPAPCFRAFTTNCPQPATDKCAGLNTGVTRGNNFFSTFFQSGYCCKESVCPEGSKILTLPDGSSPTECDDDDDCPDASSCGRGYCCTNAKAGTCPVLSTCGNNRPGLCTCIGDIDCPGTQKCCLDACNYRYCTPVFLKSTM